MHKIAKGLLEYETLTAEDISNILNDKEVNRTNTNTENISIDSEKNQSIKKNNANNPRPHET